MAAAGAQAQDWVVTFRPEGRALAPTAIQLAGGRALRANPALPIFRVRGDRAVARALRGLSTVRAVEPDVQATFDHEPNDPLWIDQSPLRRIGMPRFWDAFRPAGTVTIAILDDGVQTGHPDLRDQIAPGGYNFVDQDNDPRPAPGDEGHGTHVAGVAAARSDNGIGMASPGYRARILPLRIASLGDSVEAVIYAADQGARVINMSYGFRELATSVAHRTATDYAAAKGVLLFSSAGNEASTTPSVPKSDPAVIVVGATDGADRRAWFSNFGPWVDLAAPGTGVLGTVGIADYQRWDGTSMASPLAAGLAAALLETGATATVVRDALFVGAQPVGDWLAHGRIDGPGAWNALLGASEPVPVSGADVLLGTGQTGGPELLEIEDGTGIEVDAVPAGRLGRAVRVEFRWTGLPADLRALSLRTRAEGFRAGTAHWTVWDPVRESWTELGSAPPGRKTFSVPVEKVREGRLVVRCLAQSSARIGPPVFRARFDQVVAMIAD
jgi:thermitase